jgi:hypothetical protein
LRAALAAKGITPCILPRKNRKVVIDHDKTLHRQRHRIENTFGRLKDFGWIYDVVVFMLAPGQVMSEPLQGCSTLSSWLD